MGMNYSRDDDEPSDRQRLAATEFDSAADIEPPADYLHEFPDWRGSVDVVIPKDVARGVAHRVGVAAARGKTVTERVLLPNGSELHVPLAEWVEQRGVLVERTEGGRDSGGDRHYLTAFNDETWNGGFDLPFCRTRFPRHRVSWPFGDVAYANMMQIVDRFDTNDQSNPVGVNAFATMKKNNQDYFHPDSHGFMWLEEASRDVKDFASIDRSDTIPASYPAQHV